MVADLNLLGSVGDLYCFSNTHSMLVYYAFILLPICRHHIIRDTWLSESVSEMIGKSNYDLDTAISGFKLKLLWKVWELLKKLELHYIN